MRSIGRPVGILLVVIGLLIGTGVATTAQEASPDGTVQIDHPAYLQAGTCEQPGDPNAALAETSTGQDDRPRTDLDAAPATTGPQIPAAVSVTEVDRSLDDLLNVETIVRVVESEQAPETTIACGAIGGEPDEDGNLYLALTGAEASNVAGVVWLQEDGDATTVTLFLIPALPNPSAAPSSQ